MIFCVTTFSKVADKNPIPTLSWKLLLNAPLYFVGAISDRYSGTDYMKKNEHVNFINSSKSPLLALYKSILTIFNTLYYINDQMQRTN